MIHLCEIQQIVTARGVMSGDCCIPFSISSPSSVNCPRLITNTALLHYSPKTTCIPYRLNVWHMSDSSTVNRILFHSKWEHALDFVMHFGRSKYQLVAIRRSENEIAWLQSIHSSFGCIQLCTPCIAIARTEYLMRYICMCDVRVF